MGNIERNNAPLVSVIIPIYNGENYIVRCLNSIKEQGRILVEIILIDDGSTDDSLKVICDYCEKNPHMNIKTISQKNEGQGSARNKGIIHATGQYVCFVDQDDTLPPDIVQRLVSRAEDTLCDVVISGYQRVTEEGKSKRKVRLHNVPWSKYRVIAPWSKLYRRDFLQKHNIQFLPVVLGEDIYFLMRLYAAEPKVVVDDGIGYNWTDSPISVSNTVHKKIGEDTSLLLLFEKLQAIEGIAELNRDRMFEFFLLKTAIWDMLYTTRYNSKEDIETNSNAIWEWMSVNYPKYLDNPYIPFWKLKGESIFIRLIVSIMVWLHRVKCDTKILVLLNKVSD